MIVFALAGIVLIGLELAPQFLGFQDTDDPSVSLRFLREHRDVYVLAGLLLVVMAIALVASVVAVMDVLASRADALGLRVVAVLGVFAAACFLMYGVLRLGAGPLLYIDSLDRDWGEAAYLVVQIVGIHGVAQAAILTLCLWAVGVGVLGYRSRSLPTALCAWAVIPAVRLFGILGPLGLLPDTGGVAWIVFMLSIPGTMLWCLALGVVLLRGAGAGATDTAPIAVPA